MTYQKIINEKVRKLKAIDFTNVLKKNCMLINVKLLYFIIIHKDDYEKSTIEEIDQILWGKPGVYFTDSTSITDYVIFSVFDRYNEWSNMYINVCLEILCNYGILYKLSNYNLVDNFIESLNVEINNWNKHIKFQEKIFHNWNKYLMDKYINEKLLYFIIIHKEKNVGKSDHIIPNYRYYILKKLIVIIDKKN